MIRQVTSNFLAELFATKFLVNHKLKVVVRSKKKAAIFLTASLNLQLSATGRTTSLQRSFLRVLQFYQIAPL